MACVRCSTNPRYRSLLACRDPGPARSHTRPATQRGVRALGRAGCRGVLRNGGVAYTRVSPPRGECRVAPRVRRGVRRRFKLVPKRRLDRPRVAGQLHPVGRGGAPSVDARALATAPAQVDVTCPYGPHCAARRSARRAQSARLLSARQASRPADATAPPRIRFLPPIPGLRR